MKAKFGYVDGFILPVPRKSLKAYKKLAKVASQVWMDHGAIAYCESIADDVPEGKVTSFSKSVKLKKGEVVIFAYALYKTKADRNRAMKKVMADPRLAAFDWDNMPWDGMRMYWGGFKPIISL